jgi:hypothetical protein
MSNKRIKDFNSFVNESYYNDLDEGIFSTIKKYGKMALDWSYQLLKNIIDGLVAPIPYGPKKGLPTIMLFIPGPNGTIYDQMMKYEKGMDPISNRTLSMSESKMDDTFSLEDDRTSKQSFSRYKSQELPLIHSAIGDDEDIKSVDSRNGIVETYSKKTKGINSRSIFIKSDSDKKKMESVASAGDSLVIPVLYMELKYIKSSDLFREGEVNISNILPPNNGKNDKGGIIFLENLDEAERNIIEYFTKLSKEGSADGYSLPSKWVIVASGKNPDLIGDISGFSVKDK